MKFWEHPDMQQIIELVCLKCVGVQYIMRTKDQPYPFVYPCPECKAASMPTQEKQDWLATLRKESDSSPAKPSPKIGSA